MIDLGNILGVARNRQSIQRVWHDYSLHVPMLSGDAVIVGTDPRLAPEGWFALPQSGIRRVLGRGIDGAHRALLDSVDVDHDFTRFGTLIIASGDHAFAPLAQAARDRGAHVFVVVGAGTLRKSLQRLATRVFRLPSRSAMSMACA